MLKIKDGVELKDFQKQASEFACSRKASLMSLKTGTGKSLIAINIAKELLNNKEVSKFIIVGTKSSVIELKNDLEDKLRYDDDYLCNPFIISDDYSLNEFFNNENEDIALLQYESINRINLGLFDKCLKKYKTCFAFDESHKLKNPKALLTRSFYVLRRDMYNIIFLTATPLTTSLIDLFYQIHFLDNTVFKNKNAFVENFINMKMIKNYKTGREYPEIVSYKNLPLLRERIKDICFDYYPEQDTNYIIHKTKIENTDKYIEASEGLFDTKDAKIHAVRLIDLQKVVDKSHNKVKLWLKAIHPHLKEGLITYCHFHETVEILSRVLNKLNIDYRVIHGQISTKERKDIKIWFNSNPANKVLLITSAGSQSLNLQSVNNMFFYNIPFGWGAFSQAKGRIERLFSKHTKFNIHFILTEVEIGEAIHGTIDYYKHELISSYGELTSTVFEANEVPKSQLQSFNRNLLNKLKNQMLWLKKKK